MNTPIVIEKLVFGGQGLGRRNGKAIFVWNALPCETVEVDIIRDKKTHAEGVARTIIVPSADRIALVEEHGLICSPWSIMSTDAEKKWKIETAKEVYSRTGGFDLPFDDIVWLSDKDGTPVVAHYRNKIEYSFGKHADESVSFAFFERGQRNRHCIDLCMLASSEINQTAQKVFDWVIKKEISIRSLKALIVRSNRKGETIAALFLKDEMKFNESELKALLSESFIGFQIYYSTHKSPASVPTRLMYTVGVDALEETLKGVRFSYGAMSFFQISPPIFELALDDIAAHVDPKLPLLDFYSGVGSIGLTLAKKVPSVLLVESNPEAVENAKKNIALNGLEQSVEAVLAPAEKITEAIVADIQLVLDPPRAGLHPDVLKRILEVRPQRILYLSCDLSTHARDVAALRESYSISFSRLYNFFPRTPHVEGLIVLEKK